MKIIIKILVTYSLFVGLYCEAQQLPQFTQYMYNMASINPAFAGAKEVMVITLLHRDQWVGVNGGPVTQTLSVNSMIPDTKFGVGLSAINDKIGYENTVLVNADVSYSINLNQREHKLVFGLKAGFSKHGLDNTLLSDDSLTDEFLDRIDNTFKPSMGVGVYYRTNNYFLGVSSPRMVTNFNKSTLDNVEQNSYYANGGYLLRLSNLKIKPGFIFKYTADAPISLDLTSTFIISDKIYLSGMYRLKDAIGALFRFNITEGFSVGYSYDYTLSNLGAFSNGSHDILLNYEFNFPRPSCKCKNLYN